MILTHPSVIGELALGDLRERETILSGLMELPGASVATAAEVLHFIARHALIGRGIGSVDVHLPASATLTSGAALWTHDKRLHEVAAHLALAFDPGKYRLTN